MSLSFFLFSSPMSHSRNAKTHITCGNQFCHNIWEDPKYDENMWPYEAQFVLNSPHHINMPKEVRSNEN